MKTTRRATVVALSMLLMLFLGLSACGDDGDGGGAPERTIADLSALSGDERQSALEEGARAEGSLSIATIVPGLEDAVAAFEDKYPFIDVELFETRAAALIERVLAEKAAGTLSADIILGSDADLGPIQDGGILTDFDAPGAAFVGELKASIVSGDVVVFGYSTERVSDDEIPQTLDDLLDPRLEGRISLYGPPNFIIAGWTGMLIQELGEEEATRLLQGLTDQVALFNESAGSAALQLILRGEVDIGQITISTIRTARREFGEEVPIDFTPLDLSYAFTNRIGAVDGAPHPHAALLFIDYVLSQEGQDLLAETAGDIPAAQFESLELEGKVLTQVYFEKAEDTPFYEEWEQLFSDTVVKGREVIPEEEE